MDISDPTLPRHRRYSALPPNKAPLYGTSSATCSPTNHYDHKSVDTRTARRWLHDARTLLYTYRTRLYRWFQTGPRQERLVRLFLVLCNLAFASRLAYCCVNTTLRWLRAPKYRNAAERDFRSERFPSIDDRVRYYMSNWYLPPCDDESRIVYQKFHNESTTNDLWNRFIGTRRAGYYYEMTEVAHPEDQNLPRTVIIPSTAALKRLFVLEDFDLSQCHQHRHWSIRDYCSDASLSILNTARADLQLAESDSLPIVAQFGDYIETVGYTDASLNELELDPRIPYIKKLRYALPKSELDRLTGTAYGANHDCLSGPRLPPSGLDQLQPILWLLNINRHFKYAQDVPRYDIPWSKKRNAAVFRGILTGLEYDRLGTDDEKCQELIRCKLVYETATSEFIDAKLTSTFNKMPEVFHGVKLTGKELKKEEIMSYKVIIILEGNDVSSGLKWGMLSKSVVVMPKPRYSSWSMEELLEPWVQYVPIENDLSDVEEKVQWVLQHQSEAQRISHRASLWVMDLYFHPDAMKVRNPRCTVCFVLEYLTNSS